MGQGGAKLRLMKTFLCTVLAVGLVGAQLIFGSGCAPAHEGLDEVETFAYAPDETAAPYFEAVAIRIYEASGVVIFQDPEGTPIRFVPTLPSDSSYGYDCGQTPITFWEHPFEVRSVNIDVLYPTAPGCDSLRGALTHEVIHSLRRKFVREDGKAADHGHTASGVFHRTGGDKLDEASLNAICEAVDCTTYNPEN